MKKGRKLLCAWLFPPICHGTSDGRIPGCSILEESPTTVILWNTMSIKHWLQSGPVCQVLFIFVKFYSDLSNLVLNYQIQLGFVNSLFGLSNSDQICEILLKIFKLYLRLSDSIQCCKIFNFSNFAQIWNPQFNFVKF